MRRILQSLSLLLLLSIALSVPVAATCGGGGGGGLGGFPSGPGPEAQTYQVPWRVVGDDGKPAAGNLVVLWFPTSPDQARRSSLQTSRNLTLWSARCVAMALVPGQETALHTQYTVTGEAVVLTDRSGKEVGRLAGGEKWLFANDVEKLVGSAIKKLEDSLDGKLDAAKEKEKGGDVEGAASLYSEVFADRCLSPGPAKKAAKALRKLGKPVPEDQAMWLDLPQPDLSPAVAAKVINALDEGLQAERGERYEGARGWYLAAHRIDPGDPVPLRYLGELYRHHTGEWVEARQVFEEILRRQSDPLSRAVALHGLGKMTIHEGNSPKGLALFEESVATYPLALAYRNLAVFWNSEGKRDKARVYVDKALALDPDEPFNKIFAATYLVEDGKAAEALRIAQANDTMMAASYNLAAIYAMSGQRDKALALLQRHFFQYEKYDPVRAHEMKEAREDIVFKTLHADPAFVDLTKQALPPAHGMPGATAPTPNGG